MTNMQYQKEQIHSIYHSLYQQEYKQISYLNFIVSLSRNPLKHI